MPILLNGKKKRNRNAFNKKASSKAAFLILPLYNSFEDALLLFSFYPLIVSSSFYLSAAKSSVGVFGKDNARKSKRDDPGNTSADIDRRIEANNLGTKTDPDTKTDNLDITANNFGTAADNLGTITDNLGIAADILDTATDNPSTAANNPDTAVENPGITTDNPGTEINANIRANNPGTAADDPSTGTDADVGANNPGIVASNKARAASLFALRHAFFLLISFSELVIASLPSSLPSSSLITLQSKLILLYSVTLVK